MSPWTPRATSLAKVILVVRIGPDVCGPGLIAWPLRLKVARHFSSRDAEWKLTARHKAMAVSEEFVSKVSDEIVEILPQNSSKGVNLPRP